jgi:hypothetical protein
MFDFFTADVRRLALSSIGALLLSGFCLVTAAGPAFAETPTRAATVTVFTAL